MQRPYDWKQNANSEGPQQAKRIPTGTHQVEITRVVFGKKDGPAFASSKGDPQIMVIFADSQARECSTMLTLSDAAGWVLAKLLDAAGANLDRMIVDNIMPQNFADPNFAIQNLVGRRLTVQIAWAHSAKDNKDYAKITPIQPDHAARLPQAQAPQPQQQQAAPPATTPPPIAAPPINPDSIPF